MIFVCHIFQRLNWNTAVAELLTSGVPLFLFVSGYLTGISNKTRDKVWLIRRSKRVLLPYYILLLLVFLVCLFIGQRPITPYWLFFAANIQGLKNFLFLGDIFCGIEPPVGGGLGHFWYVTIIMLCYIAIFTYSRLKVKKLISISSISLFVCMLIAWPLLLLLNIQLNSILAFLGGAILAKVNKGYTATGMCLVTIAVAFFVALRFVARYYIDGSLYYNEFLAPLTCDIVAIWIFYFVFYIGKLKPSIIDRIASWKGIVALDAIIYEFFLTHHMFIKGSWSVFDIVNNTAMAIFVLLCISLVSSVLLNKLCKISTKLLKI